MDGAVAKKTVTQSSRASIPATEYNPSTPPDHSKGAQEVRIVVDNTGEDKVDLALRALNDVARGNLQDVDADRLTQLIKDAAPVLSASQELRTLCNSERVAQKTPYPGLRAGVDPIAFLKEHYGEEIASGAFGPGQLSLIDSRLYAALRYRLPNLEGSPSIHEFFESLRDPSKQGASPYQRRAIASADLLGTDVTRATQFLGTLRPDRLKARSTLDETPSPVSWR